MLDEESEELAALKSEDRALFLGFAKACQQTCSEVDLALEDELLDEVEKCYLIGQLSDRPRLAELNQAASRRKFVQRSTLGLVACEPNDESI